MRSRASFAANPAAISVVQPVPLPVATPKAMQRGRAPLRVAANGSIVRGLSDIVNRSVPKGCTKIRASAGGLPKRERKLDNTGVRTYSPSKLGATVRPPTHRVSSSSRRGCFVFPPMNWKVSVSPQVKWTAFRPRLRTHGRLTRRRRKSDWLPTRRHRYRQTCLARTRAPLAS